jgi:hypothetical protein
VKARAQSENLTQALPKIECALDLAEKAVEAGNIDGAWQYFQVANRLELLALEGPKLSAAATAIRGEAHKLNAWREEAVTTLLSPQDGQEYDPVRVYGAALLRDEHYNNEAYKDGLRRAMALWLALALIIGLAGLYFLASCGPLDRFLTAELPLKEPELLDTLLTIGLFGYVGATISAITTAGRSDKPSRIPEMTSTIRVTTLRLLMGPLSAIIVYFAVKSDFYSDLIKFEPDAYAFLVIAFVAGFTERLVRRVVETVAAGSS